MLAFDLPTIWAFIIAFAIFAYVVMDGFDLGIGILFSRIPVGHERDTAMNSIAPVWDGNETWLVLGGGGLFAAFPLAYAAIMPALYLPIVLMLLALILRGVAFEFRHHGRARGKAFWTAAFAGGSLAATLAQGLVLGGFIQGVTLKDGAFAGGPLDWLTPYSLVVAAGLVAGYALLGAGWMVWRTEGELQAKARHWGRIAAAATAGLLAVVSLATLTVHPRIAERWGFAEGAVDFAALAPLLPIPLVGLIGLAVVAWGLRGRQATALAGAYLVFLSGYIGLAVGFFPPIVPYDMDFRAAANADNALGLMLVGVGVLLPVILGYTVWVYWLFRGKVGAHAGYH
jgi:cytochrome bd ubiquinol oxidase subunit II